MDRTKHCKYEDWESRPMCTPGGQLFMRIMTIVLCVIALLFIVAANKIDQSWPLVPAGIAAVLGFICNALG